MTSSQIKKSNANREIRIGIIGAGPAGLSTAHYLRQADYENVTVMESALGIGGKATTFSVDNLGYDVGALMLGSRYKEILGLAESLGCEMESFAGRAYDIDTGLTVEGNDKIGRYEHLIPKMKEYHAVRNLRFKGIDEPGHGAISETELAAPMRQWLRDRQLEYLGDCWGLAYTSAGYGYLDDDIPAAYLAKFIECSEGGIQIFKNGFHDFWERLSKDTNVITDQRVVDVKRPSTQGKTGPITVVCESKDGVSTVREFDRLIFACGPRATISALGKNATSTETGLLSEIRTLDYYTIIASASGLPTTRGLTTIPNHCETRKQGAGHITGYHCAHEGVGTYIFYAYGREDFTPEDVIESIGGDIRAMGGELTAVHYQSRWDYFPHVNSLTMSRGFFSAFESIQGLNGCYFTGGMMDFEFTENCARYGRRLVERFFNGAGIPGAPIPTPSAISAAAARLASMTGKKHWVDRGSMITDTKARNWASALREAATECPDKVAFTWLDGNVKETATLTYGELFRQARAVAQYLVKVAGIAPKTCVLLCYAPGLSFLPVLFGTMMADCIAVPLAPPNPLTLAKDIRRFTYLTADTGATLVLCERNYMLATSLMALKSKFMGHVSVKWPETLQWVVSERIVQGTDLVPENFGHDISPDDVAVIQYSSGSTADPKGIMLSHENLLHNVDLMSSEISLTSECSICFWVPQFHDLGLIGGFLNVIRAHARGYVLSPLTFLQKPETWLSAISQYRVDFTAAPNFAYELCARKISLEAVSKLDLTCLRGTFNGAEPVRRPTMERFSKLTESAGFDPASFKSLYGQAETCAYICGFTNKEKGFPSCIKVDEEELHHGRIQVEKQYQRYPIDVISDVDDPKGVLVGIGYPSVEMGVEVRIVDPERHVIRPPNVVGEIWVSSRSKGSGYWGRDDVNELTFRARLAGSYDGYTTTENQKERSTWLRTGDLGFMYDGEVYIAGRQKDLLIINGKNHYPQDIEVTTQEADARVRPGCVIAVAGVGVSKDGSIDGATEHLVLLAELRPNANPSEYTKIRETIARAIVVNHSVSPRRIVLLKARALPKTTSGKVQRSRAGAMLDAGDFKNVMLHDSGDSAELKMKSQFALTRTISLNDENSKSFPSSPASPISPVQDLFDIRRKIVDCIQPYIRPGVGPSGPPDMNANLIKTYGLDSLAAVHISGQIQNLFNVEMDVALFYSEPTIAGVSAHISELLKDQISALSTPTSPTFSVDSEPEVDLTAIRIKVIQCMLPFMRPGVGPAGTPNTSVNLIETYGFDSLAVVQFTGQLEAQFQVEIGVPTLFSIPTVEYITAHIAELLSNKDGPKGRFQENPTPPYSERTTPGKIRGHAELTRSRSTVDLPRSRSTILGMDQDMESALDMLSVLEKVSKTVAAFRKPDIGPRGPPALNVNIVETYGYDSITAVRFAGVMQSEFGVEINTGLLFDYPTIQAVAEHISGLLGVAGRNDSRKQEGAASVPKEKSIFSPKVRRLIPSMEVLNAPPRKGNSVSSGLDKKGSSGNISRSSSREDITLQASGFRIQPNGVQQKATKLQPSQTEKEQPKGWASPLPVKQTTPKRSQFAEKEPLNEQSIKVASLPVQQPTPKRPQIVTIHARTKASGNRPTLICVHPLLGSAAIYIALGNCLNKDQPMYGLESSAFEYLSDEESMGVDENGNRVHRDESVTVMTDVYASVLNSAHPTGEFQLLGYSFGGIVAYSLARRLEEMGRRVLGVFLIDAPSPLESTISKNLEQVSSDVDHIIADVDNQRLFRGQPVLRQRVARHVEAIRMHRLDIQKVGAQDQFSVHYFRATELQVSQASTKVLYELLLEHPRFYDRAFGWERYTGQVTLERSIPGNHFTVMNPENVRFWASSVQQALDRNSSWEKKEESEATNWGKQIVEDSSKNIGAVDSDETLHEKPIGVNVASAAIRVPVSVQKVYEGSVQPYIIAFLVGVLAVILAKGVRA